MTGFSRYYTKWSETVIKKIINRLKLTWQTLRWGRTLHYKINDLSTLSKVDLERVKIFFPMPKFFIFGHARSGTTLLARLIRLHPEVHCNWQTHFFTREPTLYSLISDIKTRAWLQSDSNRWNWGKDLSLVVLRVVADFIMEQEARERGKWIVGDKSPNTLMHGKSVELLHNVYPDGKLLFIIRDGRDTLLSHRFQSFIDFPEYLGDDDLQIRDDFIQNSEPFFEGKSSLFTEMKLRKVAKVWVRNLKETNQVGKELYGDQFFVLKYEDLISDPYSLLNRLWNFLEVNDNEVSMDEKISREMSRNPDADWQRTKNQEMVNNLEKGTTGTWKELFTRRDCQILKEVAGDTLIHWGYEENYEW